MNIIDIFHKFQPVLWGYHRKSTQNKRISCASVHSLLLKRRCPEGRRIAMKGATEAVLDWYSMTGIPERV
jgi:hypothetical protein